MLLYACDLLWPVAFAASLAVASKQIFRVELRAGLLEKREALVGELVGDQDFLRHVNVLAGAPAS